MAEKKNIEPVVLAVGAAVIAGVVLFSANKKRRCKKLPDIYAEEGPLHLTEDAQDRAYEAARYKLREYMLANEQYSASDVRLYVADQLRDCSWEDLDTDEQKAVWEGIGMIISEIAQQADANPDAFLSSF